MFPVWRHLDNYIHLYSHLACELMKPQECENGLGEKRAEDSSWGGGGMYEGD